MQIKRNEVQLKSFPTLKMLCHAFFAKVKNSLPNFGNLLLLQPANSGLLTDSSIFQLQSETHHSCGSGDEFVTKHFECGLYRDRCSLQIALRI